MILVDANLLLYARLSSFPEHGRAHAWLDAQLNARAGVGLPWESLTAFLRLATNPRFLPRPLSMEQAWTQVRDWLALPSTWCPAPADDHASILDGLIRGAGLTPKLVMDAHLAALAMGHGLVLCSADGDFARFRGLKLQNPLREA